MAVGAAVLALVAALSPSAAHSSPPTSNSIVTAQSLQPVSAKRTKGPVASKQWMKAALAKPHTKITKKQRKKYEKIAQKVLTDAASGSGTSAAARGPVTSKVLDAYKICNMFNSREFCSPSIAWEPWMNQGHDWSKAHTDKDERAPVPYPSALSGQGFKFGFVYLIQFRPQGFVGPVAGPLTVWKFGETGQEDWAKRAGQSLAECTLSKWRVCWPELVAVTVPMNGKHHARYEEASAIKKWNLTYGGGNKHYHLLFGYIGCPPGNRKSCR